MLPKIFKEPSVCQARFKILYTDYLHQLYTNATRQKNLLILILPMTNCENFIYVNYFHKETKSDIL